MREKLLPTNTNRNNPLELRRRRMRIRLNSTSFPHQGSDMVIPSPYMEGYLWYNQELFDVTEDNMSPHVAEGNVLITPHEMAQWVKLLLSGQAGLTPETAGMMMDVEATGESHGYYGLGCIYTPGLGFGHNGGHIGYLTVMRYDPVYDATVVIANTVLNAEDLQGQADFMYNVGYEARKILGYPTE